jgi:hypothetical protein
MIDLGSLGPLDHNGASDVSADGAIIVGASNELPFRWTVGTGMVALPLPVGFESGSAAAITAEGSVILGVAIGTTNQLVYWDASGVHDLGAALGAAVPAGWVLQGVSGISDDGRTFSGWGLHNGVYEAWVAMLAAAGCYPNCDASTASPILNVADYICFMNKYAAGDSYANCDGSTSAPVLNVADYICFMNKYAAGCP